MSSFFGRTALVSTGFSGCSGMFRWNSDSQKGVTEGAKATQPESASGKDEFAQASTAAPSKQMKDTKVRYHPRLYKLGCREVLEEDRRPDRPPCPTVPKGWILSHDPKNNYFSLFKRVELEDNNVEEYRIFSAFEVKDPEVTYRLSDGERDENPHYTFSLFISKPKSQHTGGVEFTLTCVEQELVLDAIAVHSNKEALEDAWTRSFKAQERMKNRYRGPYVNELDDDFADEIINYLDDRGINNAFAEYMTAQTIFSEDQNYYYWLQLLRQFASKEKVIDLA